MADPTFQGPVLVTGGSGAIGRFVVEELRSRGIRVLTLGRNVGKELSDAVAADVGDVDRLASILVEHRVEVVIHLAALLMECEARPYDGFMTNAGGTASVLEASRTAGVRRVVFASSKASLGALTGKWGHPLYLPVKEDHLREPRSMYGFSKKVAEDLAFHYRSERGLDVITMRFATTCGPGKGTRHGSSMITSTMIENAVDGLPTLIVQGGDERDDIIYNRDVAYGLVLAALAPELSHAIYNLGTGVTISLDDLASAVREVVPGAEISVGRGLDYMGLGMGNYCRMDVSRARTDFGFSPRFGLRQWVADYVEFYRSAKDRFAKSGF